MEEKGRRPGLLERTARALDLPVDAVAGLPRLELIGDGELRMENHRGIVSYGSSEIQISGGAFGVEVRGEELELRTMTGVELLITGRIRSVHIL